MTAREKKLTVFTCTYNRAKTLERTYESLCRQTSNDFAWIVVDDGSTDNTHEKVKLWKEQAKVDIEYIYKENGGLCSGYNTAIEHIKTPLCTCIDSDDYMPDDAVEHIIEFWAQNGSDAFAGMIGLDTYTDGQPIGGMFPDTLHDTYLACLYKWHQGDVKMVHRTDLLKKVAPMPLFPGEKFANPICLFLTIDLDLPMLVTNKAFCVVEYQDKSNSMSKNLLYQFVQSPKSFARMRVLNMKNRKMPYMMRLRNAIHYTSSCILAKDSKWLHNSPMPLTTIFTAPAGIALAAYLKWQTRHNTTYKGGGY